MLLSLGVMSTEVIGHAAENGESEKVSVYAYEPIFQFLAGDDHYKIWLDGRVEGPSIEGDNYRIHNVVAIIHDRAAGLAKILFEKGLIPRDVLEQFGI